MIAKFKGLWKNYQQRLTYLMVTVSLLGLLQIGHRTHWDLSLTHGEVRSFGCSRPPWHRLVSEPAKQYSFTSCTRCSR